jgi:hypothetical protein
MKWARAVFHLELLAHSCADMATRPTSIFPLRVTQAWAVGDVLEAPRDLDFVTAALCVDLPATDVPWWSEPTGAQHWMNATRLAKNPVLAWWRSAHAPVWNHRIVRPALLWDEAGGVREETLAALAQGQAEEFRSAAPDPGELWTRLRDELAVSRDSLQARTTAYDDKRWSPGKLEPVADALYSAANGYLDILAALPAE